MGGVLFKAGQGRTGALLARDRGCGLRWRPRWSSRDKPLFRDARGTAGGFPGGVPWGTFKNAPGRPPSLPGGTSSGGHPLAPGAPGGNQGCVPLPGGHHRLDDPDQVLTLVLGPVPGVVGPVPDVSGPVPLEHPGRHLPGGHPVRVPLPRGTPLRDRPQPGRHPRLGPIPRCLDVPGAQCNRGPSPRGRFTTPPRTRPSPRYGDVRPHARGGRQWRSLEAGVSTRCAVGSYSTFFSSRKVRSLTASASNSSRVTNSGGSGAPSGFPPRNSWKPTCWCCGRMKMSRAGRSTAV